MRYKKDHKEATRLRILEVAAKRFRKNGIAATGLAGIMTEAGLTNGAFYAHFRSKDDLVREVLLYCLRNPVSNLWLRSPDDPAQLEDSFCQYLGKSHRDNPANGCPVAALIAELARSSKNIRNAYTERLKDDLGCFLEKLRQSKFSITRENVLAIFGLLVGSLQLARTITDEKLSQEILQSGTDGALRLMRQS